MSLRPPFYQSPISAKPSIICGTSSASNIDSMAKEYEWLLRQEGVKVFQRLQSLLQACCLKLPLPTKGSSGLQSSCQPEKFRLTSPNGDYVKCVLTLLGDNIVHSEVAIRYPKAPGHVFRSIAQPDVQWKLQQVQDLSNYILRAHNLVRAAVEATDDSKLLDGRKIATFLDQIISNLHSARTAVTLPKKKSITELQENRINKCFTPPLPQDLLLSFYVASYKLICAAYHMQQPTVPGRHTFHVYQGECVIPWLNETLLCLNCAVQLCQQFRDKLTVFHNCNELQEVIEEKHAGNVIITEKF